MTSEWNRIENLAKIHWIFFFNLLSVSQSHNLTISTEKKIQFKTYRINLLLHSLYDDNNNETDNKKKTLVL